MLDLIKPHDDGFQRLRDQFHCINGFQPIGADQDINQRNRNLRLFLARQCGKSNQSHGQRCQQQQWRERGSDKGPGQTSGNA